jgi:hypothetical protein
MCFNFLRSFYWNFLTLSVTQTEKINLRSSTCKVPLTSVRYQQNWIWPPDFSHIVRCKTSLISVQREQSCSIWTDMIKQTTIFRTSNLSSHSKNFKYRIYPIILSLTPLITSAWRELAAEAPTQGAAGTENRKILLGLQVTLQFVCDQPQDVHNDHQTNCDIDNI